MRIKKKYEVGTARVFMSQKQALNKLQLTLKDFRRLCILKGIYPREPLHAKKANKGSTESKIYYHLKDINFLSSEPLIKKFREYKVFLRRLTTAKAKREDQKAQSLIDRKPVFRLDTVVRERYPTFSSALQDLDDALCLCFAFAALTQSKIARPNVIADCRRLTTEFMHYVIESHSLIKVFVSIKGIYYQAEIIGEKITWVVGHERAVGKANELDFSVMATFVDFYITMLSFVNFRLYKTLGLFYPPQLQKSLIVSEETVDYHQDDISEKVYSLAVPIDRSQKAEPEVTIDTFEENNSGENLTEKIQLAQALRSLFCKYKFFLNREVPKEPLAFIIRSCGGAVSWSGCPSQIYNESSNLITHQVVDRNVENFNVNRCYIQPQWIFDCFNARCLLPTVKYIPGVLLPPHLSPFAEENIGEYVPQERLSQLKDADKSVSQVLKEEKEKSAKPEKKKTIKKATPPTKEAGMQVQKSKIFKENKQKEINQKGHDLKLREMMIPKKHRRVYKKIKFGEKRSKREANKLQEKRAKLNVTSRSA